VVGIGTRAIMNPPVDHVEVGEACSHGAPQELQGRRSGAPAAWLPWNYEHALVRIDQRHAHAA
jgi:hypothetical protein